MVSLNARRRCIRRAAWTLTATISLQLLLASGPARAEEAALADLSLEDLMEIQVTSPSKRAERLGETSAAVYVISNEDIRRSGLNSIPELLRLVPGLHVAQIDASRWAITSRGFNSQFANKLLVLIDGRTVYTHLFSGVFWDVQDVLLEDIDRIEVIRGPGGTLWGANAVNGVINIITKSAKDTHGALASGGGGTLTGPFGHARYGTSLGDNVHVRGYVKYLDRNEMDADDGGGANDQWHMTRGGFRTDWDASANDLVTVQGDYYGGETNSTLLNSARSEDSLSGGNILGRWRHTFTPQSDVSVQLYYDRTERDVRYLIAEDRNTFDVEIEHRRRLFSIHDVVVGFGYRLLDDSITNRAITFTPDSRTDNLVSGFIQDQIPLFDDRVQLTIGSKFESNDYTGFEYQPSIRGLWKVHPRHRLWAAVSRAVRTPSRADDDVAFFFASAPPPAPTLLIQGDSGFDSEKLIAYELGYRVEPIDDLTFDLATYYNDYDDLRTTDVGGVPLPSPPFPPLTLPAPLGNRATAKGYGVELAADWSVTRFWKLSAWYTFMNLDVDRKQSSTDLTVEGSEDDTPIHQVHFRSRLNLPRNFEFDTNLFWVDNVQNQNVGSYTRLDLRLGWRPIEYVELSLVGQNLTENRHPEFGNGFFSVRSQVPRSVYGQVTLRY
jgi:iron complex outermembrane receptor protein